MSTLIVLFLGVALGYRMGVKKGQKRFLDQLLSKEYDELRRAKAAKIARIIDEA